jgi:hypothetical protein
MVICGLNGLDGGGRIGGNVPALRENLMHELLMVVFASLALAGCATVTRGTTDRVQVVSETSGAQASTSIGQSCPSTPCTFEVSRKSEFIVTFRKEGFQEATVPVRTRIPGAGAAGFAGNLLLGGVVGMGVDAATGATMEHYPNPVTARLVASASSPPSKRLRKPAPVTIAPRPSSPSEPTVPES